MYSRGLPKGMAIGYINHRKNFINGNDLWVNANLCGPVNKEEGITSQNMNTHVTDKVTLNHEGMR